MKRRKSSRGSANWKHHKGLLSMAIYRAMFNDKFCKQTIWQRIHHEEMKITTVKSSSYIYIQKDIQKLSHFFLNKKKNKSFLLIPSGMRGLSKNSGWFKFPLFSGVTKSSQSFLEIQRIRMSLAPCLQDDHFSSAETREIRSTFIRVRLAGPNSHLVPLISHWDPLWGGFQPIQAVLWAAHSTCY